MAKTSNGHGMGHNKRPSWSTRSYNFIDKDPEVDRFRTLFQKESRYGLKRETDLATLAGVSPATVKNMFGGETRNPRHSTLAKLAGALGYKYGLQRELTPNYDVEIPKAQEQRREHFAWLERKREREQKRAAK